MQMSELEAANAELEDANTQMEAVIMRRDELEAQSSSQIASLTSELRQSQASLLKPRKHCGCGGTWRRALARRKECDFAGGDC